MSKNSSAGWQFKGPLQLLQQRAFLLSAIRQFFADKNVLEVETPVLSSAGNTDVQIEVFNSQSIATDHLHSYLRTSPEFFHKRLLASGAGDLYEIAKVFRQGEYTSLHNPEFTLLEWYRLGFSLFDLIDEVIELIQLLRAAHGGDELRIETISYQQLFQQCAGINPYEISTKKLLEYCIQSGYSGSELSRTEALDFVFSVIIQPQLAAIDDDRNTDSVLGTDGVVVYDFPIAMAALAAVHPEQPDRCLRFEFLWHGVELANGYQELTDAKEQRQRFERDNTIRVKQGKPTLPIDEKLLQALAVGLPPCSGVALGIERLMMCLLGKTNIKQVMGFTAENS